MCSQKCFLKQLPTIYHMFASTNGAINLQYFKETFFIRTRYSYGQNLKWLLTYFVGISCIKLNYHKSVLMTINLYDATTTREFAQVFYFNLVSFPFKYLGVSLHVVSSKKDLHPIIDHIIKKISCWRRKLISYEGNLFW